MARSALGEVTARDLAREMALRGTPSDPESRRSVLKELLLETGLAREARSVDLAADPEVSRRLEERRQEILLRELHERYVTRRVQVGDEDVEAEYHARAVEFSGVERIRLRHVFRRVSAQATGAERAQARAEIEDLLRQIREGANFKEIARTRSDSETAKFEGRMAAVSRGQLDASVEAAVWSLEPGQVSEVVPTPLGFHIFQLEARLPPEAMDPEKARQTVRRSLRLRGEQAALRTLLDELRASSGALYRPEALEGPDRGAPLFGLDGRTVTARDLEAVRAALPFVERHIRGLSELLEEAASRRLRLWKAAALRLAEEPAVAERLAWEERRILAQAAFDRRAEEERRRIGEGRLRELYDLSPARFQEPEAHRLRVIVARFARDHSPHYFYERLYRAAADIRSGSVSFADAARALSDDPSAAQGGDLGFLPLRDFGLWAGVTALQRVAALKPGEMIGPLGVEVYNEAALVYQTKAYMLVKLEEIRTRKARSFAEAREAVADAWMADHAGEVAEGIRQDVWRSLDVVIDDTALASVS